MKDYLIFAIFMYLVKHKKTTAKQISDEFEISSRSVYRYIDSLSLLGVPLVTKLGKGGGVEIVGNFCLENIMLSQYDKGLLFDFIQKSDVPNNIRNIINKLL